MHLNVNLQYLLSFKIAKSGISSIHRIFARTGFGICLLQVYYVLILKIVNNTKEVPTPSEFFGTSHLSLVAEGGFSPPTFIRSMPSGLYGFLCTERLLSFWREQLCC